MCNVPMLVASVYHDAITDQIRYIPICCVYDPNDFWDIMYNDPDGVILDHVNFPVGSFIVIDTIH